MYEFDDYTVSLLHFDDGIKDETGKVWTADGSVAVSTDQSKIGGSSLYLNGSQDIYTPLSDDLKLETTNFTVDFWMYTNKSGSSYGTILFSNTVGGLYNGTTLYYVGNTMYGSVSVNGTSWISATNTITFNEWNHIAFIKNGNELNVAVNGVFGTPVTISGTPIESSQSNAIIGNMKNNTNFYYTGYIDEYRISNIVRWTSDFTPSGTINAPTNLTATAGDSQVTLSWTAVDGAPSYIVKRSTTSGGTYETIASSVTDTSYVDTSVTNGTTYYYVVTAVNADGESNNSNEASATPIASSKSLLRITMNDSSEREYLLTSTEIDAFINWFTRTVGTGTTCYTFNDTIDKSKEYLAFEKIISFKVIPTVE